MVGISTAQLFDSLLAEGSTAVLQRDVRLLRPFATLIAETWLSCVVKIMSKDFYHTPFSNINLNSSYIVVQIFIQRFVVSLKSSEGANLPISKGISSTFPNLESELYFDK